MLKNLPPRHNRGIGAREMTRLGLMLAGLFFLASCTSLSDKKYVEDNPNFRGLRRVAVFLQRWPVYLSLPGQHDLGEDFIKKTTNFFGPWQPTKTLNPRALDIQDIDDDLMGEILVKALEKKGYQASLVCLPFAGESKPVGLLMAEYQAINPSVEAFLFCYYAPTLFISEAKAVPKDLDRRSYSLLEIINLLKPGSDSIIWVGERSAHSPSDSMSHAFIYLSITMFKALNWQSLMAVADSQIGGRARPWIPRCPPGPTAMDYEADDVVIQRLLLLNLKCRLDRLIPIAF